MDYKQEIINSIVKGSAIIIGIVILFSIAILVMKLVLEKKSLSTNVRRLLYILLTVLFLVVSAFTIAETIEDVSYYKNLKEKTGVVENIQYFHEHGIDSEHKASVVELKDEQGEKTKYILHGELIPNIDEDTKIKITYDGRGFGKDEKFPNTNVKGYIKTYVTQ